MLVHVLPPLTERCHWVFGAGVPDATAVKPARPPGATFMLCGCTMTAGRRLPPRGRVGGGDAGRTRIKGSARTPAAVRRPAAVRPAAVRRPACAGREGGPDSRPTITARNASSASSALALTAADRDGMRSTSAHRRGRGGPQGPAINARRTSERFGSGQQPWPGTLPPGARQPIWMRGPCRERTVKL
jgi:hypothetical protein